MIEKVEFRIPELKAAQFLPAHIGELQHGSVRKVVVRTDDPLFFEIGRLQNDFRKRGEVFFFGRVYHRTYTQTELENAELLTIRAERSIEPPGELCGTAYEDSKACPECGAGAPQATDLRLDLRKVPRKLDIAETIAGELIMSQRFAQCLIKERLRGYELHAVRHKARYQDDPIDLEHVPAGREILRLAEAAGAPHPTWMFWVWLNDIENRELLETAQNQCAAIKQGEGDRRPRNLQSWYQLRVTSGPVDICPPTRTGSDPFDDASYGACSRGDLLGLNLLSEVTVKRSSWDGSDLVRTRQFIGARRGLLRPWQILLLSRKGWRAIRAAKLRGVKIEVANFA